MMTKRDKTRQTPAKQRAITRRIARHSKAVAIAMAHSAAGMDRRAHGAQWESE